MACRTYNIFDDNFQIYLKKYLRKKIREINDVD